jgi:hypothetical protein
MVDALREIWTVLESGGTLLDLRPELATLPLEVVSGDVAQRVGVMDARGAADRDLAADRAMETAVSSGLYAPLGSGTIEVKSYWDNAQELDAYVQSSGRATGFVPAVAELEEAREAWAREHGAPAQLRSVRPLKLATYRKVPQPPTSAAD